jgi:hypothetical protein
MSSIMPWFDPNALIWIGPGVGLLEALWGGAVGLLAYALARKGRGRSLVFGHLYAGLATALGLLVAGAAAWREGQPLAIYVFLLAAGAPLLAAALLSLVNVTRLYRLTELRRMQAQEL